MDSNSRTRRELLIYCGVRRVVCHLAVVALVMAFNFTDAHAASSPVMPLQVNTIELGEAKIQLAFAGKPDAPPLVFIHGSPGSWQAWYSYMSDPELANQSFLVAMDRPGFGGSNYGESGLSLAEQTSLIYQAMQQQFPDLAPAMLIGHSYGAPVVLQMAADYPESASSTLLLAPAIDPDVMRVRWYNQAARLLPVRLFLSESWRHSNDEMLQLPKQLKVLQAQLSNVAVDTTVIQGGKDKLVNPKNADYATRALSGSVEIHLLAEANHFIPWRQYPLVKAQLLEYLQTQGQSDGAEITAE